MEERVNHIIEEAVVKPQAPPPAPKKLSRFGRLITEVLGGEFLAYDWSRRQLNYIVFLAAVGVVYISNSYYAESIVRRIDDMNRELKELHYEYISSKSKVMNQSKQSVIIKKLENSGLKESVEPVRKIIANKKEQ
jgi:hypothetical protein